MKGCPRKTRATPRLISSTVSVFLEQTLDEFYLPQCFYLVVPRCITYSMLNGVLNLN